MRMRLVLASLMAMITAFGFVPSYAAGEARVVVGTDEVGDNPIDPDAGPVWDAAGLDVTQLAIHQPDFSVPELEFIMSVNDLQAVPAGEVIRYLWQMTVNGKEYWITAKTSDLSTATAVIGDPQGSVEHAVSGSAIRLRSNCGVTGVISSCAHVMWLSGEFDVDANEVRIKVPLGNALAPDFASGNAIEPDAEGAEAGIQAVISNANTTDKITQEGTYLIP